MNIKSILAVTDLSARESMVIERARQLARSHRATVKLMHLPARGQPPADAASRLADAAKQLEESLELRVRTAPPGANRLEDVAAQARGMDLVVLPHRHERSLAALFRGQPVWRLLRRCGTPVLVARRAAATHYRRLLVAVDFSFPSKALVKLAAGFAAQADVELFHAVGARSEARPRSTEDAQARMVSLIGSVGAQGSGFCMVIGRGSPARQAVIHQEHAGADLVIVGKKRSLAWEDFLCGSVAHRILRAGTSDVLVVPHAPAAARRPAGRRSP